MKDFFVHLWTDEKKFLGFVRGLILAVSGVFLSGKVDLGILPDALEALVPAIGLFLAGFIRSGGSSGNAMDKVTK